MAKQSLVIVESPAKAKTIGKYLGKDYEVKACMGHLRDLQKSKLSVDVDNDFEPVYKPIKGKEAIISDLKKSAKAADTVYLATDPDREGEAISWHLKSLLDLPDKKTKRVTFNEITKNVVRQSIENPRDIDQNLVDAQHQRPQVVAPSADDHAGLEPGLCFLGAVYVFGGRLPDQQGNCRHFRKYCRRYRA